MRNQPQFRLLLVVLSVVLLATHCGSAGDDLAHSHAGGFQHSHSSDDVGHSHEDGEGSGDPATVPIPLSDGPVTEREAHQLLEEAIQTCMRGQGFEYSPQLYVEAFDEGTSIKDAGIFLSGAETRGYGGVFLGLVQVMVGPDAPPESMSVAEVNEFTKALSGDTGGGGCVAEAKARAALLDVDTLGDPFADPDVQRGYYDRVTSSDAFRSFEVEWASCMLSVGVDVNAIDAPPGFVGTPQQIYSVASQFDYSRQTAQRLSALLNGSDPSWALTRDDLTIEVASTEWMEQIAASDIELADILASELAQARIDRDCRERSRGALAATLDSVLDEMGLNS